MKKLLSLPLLLLFVSGFTQSQKTLLAIFAHPDDEGAIGSVLVKYAATHKVYIIIATDGRYGVREHAGIPAGDSLAAMRKKEMQCACEKLGVQPPILLGFHDGMGMRTGVGEAFTQLHKLTEVLKGKIDSLNPNFIITFGPDGDTGHPDHRTIGNVTTQIILQEGWDKKYPLYYVAWTKKQSDATYPPNLNYMDNQYLNVAVKFENQHEEIAWQALKCHTSQLTAKEMEEWIAMDKKDSLNTFYFRKFVVKQGVQKDF
ncbi:MAG: PIG-L deacetylase family protein [Bacteroidota bacterium]